MRLEDSSLCDADDLVAVVHFENFGQVATLVNLSFEVFDVNGSLVFSEDDFVVVGIEELLRQRFGGLVLADGDYVLVVTTLYDVDVVDEFEIWFGVVEFLLGR